MLHKDVAQQRPGNQPASAPEASQKPLRAQKQANSKIPAFQRMSSRPGDTTAADLTARNMDLSHISFIHGRPSPPPRRDSTPHAPTPTLRQGLDLTKKRTAQAQAHGTGCTRPSLRGRTRASRQTQPAATAGFYAPRNHNHTAASTPLPFGEGNGHIDTPLTWMRDESHGVQCLTSQKLHTKTMHPTRDRETQLSHQAGTLHTEKYTLNQHHHIVPLAPRFHPVGGSFTHQPQEVYGCETGPYNAQDTAEITTPKQSHRELTAQG